MNLSGNGPKSGSQMYVYLRSFYDASFFGVFFFFNVYSSHLETVVLGYIEGNGICNQPLKCFSYKIH